MREYTKIIHPHGDTKEHANKDKRSLSWSQYQYVPYYLNEDEQLDIFVTGKTDGKVTAVTGLPSDKENMSTYPLVSGSNVIYIKKSGILSFVNKSNVENVNIKITSSHQRVPYFNLYENSNLDFEKEMQLYSDAKYVILSNKSSDIIVSYSSAKKYIKDVEKLMENHDVIIDAENSATGVFSNGKADYKLDPNRSLHIEVDNGYMFATHGYTGYNDIHGAMTQLLGLSNERWGVWHENGHQRQQSPWQWPAGSGLTEVTTNIYSLFAQEAIYGKASRIDELNPEIKNFLENDDLNKSYDDLDVFVKLGLFWQLRLAFGDQFYPQLHQLYRLMQNIPRHSNSHQQKQLFILTVSNLVNVNLSPFFSKWGLGADLNTISNISFLPTLEKKIWENTNDNYHELEMPEPTYIPELIYFKNSVSNVTIEKNKVTFIIDKNWYSPYDYTFKKNDVYVGSISNGQHAYCLSILTDNGYEIIRNFPDEDFLDNDIFSIEVDYQGKHIVYYSSIAINKLWEEIKNIYTDDDFTELKIDITQNNIDELWEQYNSINNDHAIELRNKIALAQQLLILRLIKKDDFNPSNYIVEFNNSSFNDYQFRVMSDDNLIAELISGRPINSTINGLAWNIPVDIKPNLEFHISVNRHRHDFIARIGFFEGNLLEKEIDKLYSHKENEILKESVDQSELDSLRYSISNSHLPFWKKASLLDELDTVQRIYLANTIVDTYISNKHFYVKFSEDMTFKKYRYMLYSDGIYISEVSRGSVYYSSLTDTVWKTNIENYNPESLYINTYANDTWHLVYKTSSETKNIIYDFPE